MNKLLIALCTTVALTVTAHAETLSVEAINSANPVEKSSMAGTIKLQVLLDRAAASPTVIDGEMGAMTTRALAAFERMSGVQDDGKLDSEVWKVLSEGSRPVAKKYVLTDADVSQNLIDETPDDYAKMAKLDCLCYHRVSEAIAEQFHMSEDLLKSLNPDADFSKAGTELVVTNAAGLKDVQVARIEVDKTKQEVLGFDANDKLVFFSPAVVGSEENPSPSGTMKVTAIAVDPTYTVNAKKNLNGDSSEKFSIASGPNGPVGTMWIDLSKPTFGIHGTPYPSKISTMASHGCVRLTNWDADELGRIVKVGAEVKFIN